MRWLVRLLLGVLFLGLGYVGYISVFLKPAEFPAGSPSEARLLLGRHAVAMLTTTFFDDSRVTPANGEQPELPRRILEGDVWYPTGDRAEPYPLLLFSHGFTSMRRNGRYLAEHLASHGFVVVAVDYPLTYWGAPGGPTVADVVNQPGDISFLVDALALMNNDPSHALFGRVSAERIGVFGISLGGLTSTLAGFHPRLADPRIDAVLSIAGPADFFTPRFFAETPGAPAFMMLAGTEDVLVPFAANAAPVPEKVPGAHLVAVDGGSHTGFSGGTAWLRAMPNTDAIGCWSVKRSLKESALERTALILGGAAEGIDPDVPNRLCQMDPLPRAINVLRQQMIAKVVVTAFFELTLASDAERREVAASYLAEQLTADVPEVTYRHDRRDVAPAPGANAN